MSTWLARSSLAPDRRPEPYDLTAASLSNRSAPAWIPGAARDSLIAMNAETRRGPGAAALRRTRRGIGMALAAIGLLAAGCQVTVEDKKPTTADSEPTAKAAPAEAPERYGALMAEAGHRFELLGKAAAAHRWELADFERSELAEVFDDLPGAEPPEVNPGADLDALAKGFHDGRLPDLAGAIAAHDPAAFRAAFARAAAACNGCHQASGHAFVEIPAEPGRGVPVLDPIP